MISFVQSRSAASGSLAFSSDNVTGNMIVVVVIDQTATGSTFTCSDSQGNTYASLAQINNASGGTPACGQVFYAFNIAAGPNTVTATSSGGVSKLAIHEFSSVSAFDVSNSATGSGNTHNSGSVTTNFPDELLFGFEFANTGQLSTTHGASYTQAENLTSGITQYQIVSSAGSYSSDTTGTTGKGGASNWAAEIITFYFRVDATTTPAGVSGTGAVGAPTVTGSAVAAPAGVSGTGAVGTPAVAGSAVVVLAGVSGTGAVGVPAIICFTPQPIISFLGQ